MAVALLTVWSTVRKFVWVRQTVLSARAFGSHSSLVPPRHSYPGLLNNHCIFSHVSVKLAPMYFGFALLKSLVPNCWKNAPYPQTMAEVSIVSGSFSETPKRIGDMPATRLSNPT